MFKNVKLTFDDVLCVPSKSLKSRQDAIVMQIIEWKNLLTKNSKELFVKMPIIPANMSTVVNNVVLNDTCNVGGIAIDHRYKELATRIDDYNAWNTDFISIGINEDIPREVERICIDVAHGHSDDVAKKISSIKQKNSNTIIIAGNISTVEGYKFLAKAGADIIKVGQGPGSRCTTRIVTGCGYPQFSALLEIKKFRKRHRYWPPIIADGGIKSSGDIIKAFVAGAELVMTGSLFAGCEDGPGDIIEKNGKKYKKYSGMASKDAMFEWMPEKASTITPEGVTELVEVKPKFKVILEELLGGIRSGMSYLGCKNLHYLPKSKFVVVSNNVLVENHPRF